MKNIFKKVLIFLAKTLVFLGGIFLFILVSGFFAVKFNLTKTAGNIDENTGLYNSLANNLITQTSLPKSRDVQDINNTKVYCELNILADYADYNVLQILNAYKKNYSYDLAQKMILALKLRLNNLVTVDNRLSVCENENLNIEDFLVLESKLKKIEDTNVFGWQNGEPWQIIRQAIIKDQTVLNQVSSEIGVSSRLIVSVAIVEQLRLYYTQRELFEKVFKPLKILANANKMAWGVMSIKEAAAIKVEQGLKDPKSEFYLGKDLETILDFKTSDPDKERYARLTDDKNHYYSYLYGGLIIKQAQAQWQKFGYNITNRPEILATLFNIGLQNSKPKANPLVGGSKIEIDSISYVFGSLAYEFYYSGDLVNEFPY